MSSLWKQFDNVDDQILEAVVKGGADKKLQAMAATIVSFAAGQFREKKENCGTI